MEAQMDECPQRTDGQPIPGAGTGAAPGQPAAGRPPSVACQAGNSAPLPQPRESWSSTALVQIRDEGRGEEPA
jgi:hypothetical protein